MWFQSEFRHNIHSNVSEEMCEPSKIIDWYGMADTCVLEKTSSKPENEGL